MQDGCVTCQKIKKDSQNYLTCFYQYFYNKYYISEITFDPEKNFTYLEPKKSLLNNDSVPYFDFAVSATNEDGSRIYVCYAIDTNNPKCFYFIITKREFSNIFTFNNLCYGNYYLFNLNYFKIKKEFIFSYVDHSGFVYFVKFNENMDLIQTNTTKFENIYNIDSLSKYYFNNSQGYFLILNAEISLIGKKIGIYKLSNFVNFTTNTKLNEISDLKATNLVQPTQIDKIIESNYLSKNTELASASEMSTIYEINDSSEIAKLTQNTESNKLTISSEIYQ
jgi:hypothetical protein